ncbi:uncharacterized protein [Chelonus insularis]|uniref:uncharacterized protein isoform X2 n=1 Tax=Chelonus insularis TaxID=460826 RepID=UPI001588F953|nr:uncharacterized protein LOC118070700 isoform X2 [Chelonus insularis]
MADKKINVNIRKKNCCAKIEPDSTTNDSTINSDLTNFSTDSVTSNGHFKHCCTNHSDQCICANLIKFAKAREKRKRRELERMKRRVLNSSSSDEDDSKTYNKTSRVKNVSLNSLRSLESSDPSFYTAEVEPSKPPSPRSFSSIKEPFNSDLSTGKEEISDLNHNENNDQLIIQQMKSGLFSHLPNSNSVVEEKIKPFFTRLSIVAQEKSDDNEFKECLTAAYQASQQDPKDFASRLTTILEESTLSQGNYTVQYFHNIFTAFKNVDIQNESLPKSFIDKTISPCSQSTPKKILYPFGRDTPKSTKNINKSQASPLFVSTLSRFVEAANQILTHPNISALQSPSSLCDSMSRHNDSSFTYLEKKYVGECTSSQSSVPELTEKEKEVLALCQKQLKALEDSPRIQKEASPLYRKKDCELGSKIDSPCFASTKNYEDTNDIDCNSQNDNVDDSILNEYVTQRRRCLETERMIREIQAASIQDSNIDCNFLNILTECSDFPKLVKSSNKPNSTKKVSPSLKNKEVKVSSRITPKSTTPKNINRSPKKLGTGTQSSKKKPVVKTVLSKTKIQSSGHTVSTRSPVTHAKHLNFISPHLKPFNKNRRSGSRSPSPSPSSCNKSKTPKTPTSLPKIIITSSTPKFRPSPKPKLMNQKIVPESPKSIFLPGGKYFTIPGKTPDQRQKTKKTYFKEPTPLKEKFFNIDNIRSPVKDYIDGKEMVVIKHECRLENSEKIKITPTTRKNLEVKTKLSKDENMQNVEHKVDSAKLLIETELTEPSKIGNHIFFLETSCPEDGELVLNPRQACAIESAAKMNPEMEIYLLFLSPTNFSNKTKNLIDHLKTYNNINIRRVFMNEYVKNTPLEEWWKSGIFQTSQWPREHMADVMRFLTLWKFPGIYFDLDVVIMSSLKNLTDFAGAEDSEVVAIGALGFGSKPISRRIVTEYLEDLAKNFRGDLWRHNGPDILTKVLQTICGTQNALEMVKERCEGFTVYPPHVFYPIHYNSWRRYFENIDKHTTMKLIQNSITIHVWNKLSYLKEIQVGDDVPYAVTANQYCPKIYHNCGPIF